MSALGSLGVTLQRRFLSGSGDETTEQSAELTELAFTLPKSTEVQATFAQEGLGDKLLKIFKREIQTGDGLFDEAVHIKTDTADATSSLLESKDIRAVIERIIASGGSLEIDGAIVKIEMPGRHELEEEVTMLLVTALLGPVA
jgi:hypothetical protein